MSIITSSFIRNCETISGLSGAHGCGRQSPHSLSDLDAEGRPRSKCNSLTSAAEVWRSWEEIGTLPSCCRKKGRMHATTTPSSFQGAPHWRRGDHGGSRMIERHSGHRSIRCLHSH